jgi:CDP-2,3-bis-(O-geranylgeranyl)-sn-glycerol synthase
MNIFLQSLYVLLPAYLANMAPVIFRSVLKPLAIPLDFGIRPGGKPLLGEHKTFRGLITGVLFGIGTAYFQYFAQTRGWFGGIDILDYSSWLLIGGMMGFGAIFGDAVESFFKRKRGIKPGHPWIPFDQIDFAIGGLIFVSLVADPGVIVSLIGILASFFLHIIVNHFAYHLKIRKEKW